ncbi:MFS transporter [Actinomyces urogenitalis]|uniref:MFS transporter n=1 Tax=Actinomyces urogenitalis TaxID=103621 RepID=UPI00242F2253|nr:MFS transporter [Actinomyces urogenitalis]MCI7457656.1 MFS transporter [Actinomyces urogenitalis]
MSPRPPIPPDDASHPRRRRRRSPDAASALLRALAPSVYVPTAVFALGSGAVQPVLVLAATDVGMSHAAAAGVLGLLGAVGVVSAPLTGVLVGRVGGQRSMVLGTAVAVAAVIGILLAMTVPGPLAVAVFVVGIVAQAVAANLWALARQGYVADAVPPWARARALSFLGGMMRLGVLLGPAIGAGALAIAGRRGPFVLQLLACLVALWGVLACALPDRQLHQVRRQAGQVAHQRQETTGERPPAVRSRVDHRATAVVALAITCLQLLRTNRTVLVPLWGAHLGMSDSLISLTFAAGALVDVAMFIPSGRWMDRYGRLAGIVPALVIMGVALVVTIVWTSPTGFVLGTCLMGFGNGFGSGIVMTMGADLAPSPGRERFLGWWQGIGNIGSAAGPFLVSALTSTAGLASGMWATAALGVVGGAWALVAVPRAYAHAGMDMRGRARH